jgi:hypothetical protein
MESENILFARNFFLRAFIMGAAFALLYFIAAYVFWGAPAWDRLKFSFRQKSLLS